MKKHKFIVEIEIPEDYNITEMKRYIYDSISFMHGSLNSYIDPLFNINSKSIKVVHATRAKTSELLAEIKLMGEENE